MYEKTLIWLAVVLTLAPILYLLHRLGLWAEKKGWLYYSKLRRGSVSQAVIQEVDMLVNPQIKHTIEAKRHLHEISIKGEGRDDGRRFDKRMTVKEKS